MSYICVLYLCIDGDNDDCDYDTFPLLTYVACKSEKGDCLWVAHEHDLCNLAVGGGRGGRGPPLSLDKSVLQYVPVWHKLCHDTPL